MTKKYKANSFIFPCYQPVDGAFYKWRKKYDNKPIVFTDIDEVVVDPFEHMSELERKLTKVYE